MAEQCCFRVQPARHKPKCSFEFTFKGSAAALVEKARKTVEAYGGTFRGDTKSGEAWGRVPLLGEVRAKYRIQGQKLHVDITVKPRLLTCRRIRRAIEGMLP